MKGDVHMLVQGLKTSKISKLKIKMDLDTNLAIINGLITSIILETIILLKQMEISNAIKSALGMSFISMISMEIIMNTIDVIFTGGAILNIFVIQ